MNTNRLSLALLIAATASTAFAFDADTAHRINTANSLLREGKFDEAINCYELANATLGDTKDILDYNLGVAQYRKGELATAKGLFTQAASSTDAKLASTARYNLGNCCYAYGVAAAESDKPAAIESLTQAIEHYRGSLAGDPNHVNARANIELANDLLKKLKEQQQRDEQQQQDQPKADQQQDSNRQDSEAQENESEQSQSQEDNEGQNQPDKQKPSQSEQKSDKQQSPDDEPQQSTGKSADHAAEDKSQEPDGSSSAAGDDDQSQGDEQSSPSGELKPVTEDDGSDQPAGQVGIDDGKSEVVPMSKDEALKMLQAVRDRDMIRRLRAEQIERSMHVPTDRDW
jgi:Ca-activated chloride channel homolog